MLKRRLQTVQTTQTMQTGILFSIVNCDLLYFLGLFTFCRVKMTWPAAWQIRRKDSHLLGVFHIPLPDDSKVHFGFAVNEVSELERTVNSLCYRIHYRFKNLQIRLNKLIYANCYLKHVAKKFQKPCVPVCDKAKKEIISMLAGKSVDMTDINHGRNIVN